MSGQIGLEPSPDAFVAALVGVYREVWRVLADDGCIWLNLGDSFCSVGGEHSGRSDNQSGVGAGARQWREGSARADGEVRGDHVSRRNRNGTTARGLKPKDLIGIPWRVAFALQADGWYLRSDIIWAKPNPMPESVTDRPTKAHEYVFLLSKSERYFYAAEAISEPALGGGDFGLLRTKTGVGLTDGVAWHAPSIAKRQQQGIDSRTAGKETRNARSVWRISTQAYEGAHFATMPEKLAERCILAGSRPGDLVFDPFGGSGTTVRVARKFNRRGVMLDLNLNYLKLAADRISGVQPDIFEVPA